jgi:hypothetical protein
MGQEGPLPTTVQSAAVRVTRVARYARRTENNRLLVQYYT